jgi:hypothetical protein
VEIISHSNINDVPYSNILKLMELLLCLPGTDAPTERSPLCTVCGRVIRPAIVEILKAVLVARVNFEYTCMDFFKMLCGKRDI